MRKYILYILFIFCSISSVYSQNSTLRRGFSDATTTPTVLVYPNPARSFVFLKFNNFKKVNSVIVYSIIGNEVLSRKIDQDNTRINIENLKKGRYIIRIYNIDGTTEVQSLIKD